MTCRLISSLALVALITLTGMVWVHLSHIRMYQGEVWLHLWGTHGVHTLDLVVLGVELVLILLLTIVLWRGFTRPR